jgi:putative acetyltransferase
MTIGLRPFLPADANACARIFSESVEALAADDYDDSQRAAWRDQIEDVAAFSDRLASAVSILALVDGVTAGFASLRGDLVEHLYVAPRFARRGVGGSLLDAVAKIAGGRGIAKLRADVSETARPLFERRGFVAQSRNVVALGDAWLPNTSMTLALLTARPPDKALN